MAQTKVSVRVDTRLANEAIKFLGTRSRSEAVRIVLQQVMDADRADQFETHLSPERDEAARPRLA
jgi:Arc/MetJ family transcription regulator